MTGIPEIHRALAAKYRRDCGARLRPGHGGHRHERAPPRQSSTPLLATVNPGDEVVLFEPFYDSYLPASVEMAGAVPRFVTPSSRRTPRTPPGGFDPRGSSRSCLRRADQQTGDREPRPTTPPGRCSAARSWSRIGALCQRYDAVLLVRGRGLRAPGLPRHPARARAATSPGLTERTYTVSSAGKTSALTGWKGRSAGQWRTAAAHPRALRSVHQFVTFATATPAPARRRRSALAAGPEYYAELLADYSARRDYLSRELAAARLRAAPARRARTSSAPTSARFGFDDDRRLRAATLIEKVGVAAIPPSVFYDHPEEGRRYVRFAFCKKTRDARGGGRRWTSGEAAAT